MTRFVGIGECMVELSEAGPGLYRQGFAGDTLNTAWTLRALAAPATAVGYVTAVGDDPLSADMRRFLDAAGIDTGGVRTVAGGTVGLYMIRLSGAERSFTYWRDRSAARGLADDADVLAAALAGAGAVYFSGITLAILTPDRREVLLAALAAVRARGGVVAFDSNLRPRLWSGPAEMRAWTEAGYRAATVALPTHPDEADLFGDRSAAETAERAMAYGCTEAAVKDGAGPAVVADAGGRRSVPAIAVADPVDTTGAGDSFNAGYLAGRLRGLDPAASASLGHRVAARVIRVKGALIPMEALADLREST